MKINKLIISFVFLLISVPAFGQSCDSSIDGYSKCKMSIIEFQGKPVGSVSLLNDGRVYFDSGLGKLRCSEDGNTYVDCVFGETEADSIYLRLDTSNDPLTGELDMGSNEIDNILYAEFECVDDIEHAIGRFHCDNTDKTMSFRTDLGNEVQIGQEQWGVGVNQTGDVSSDGKVVYFSGVQGNRPTFDYADARVGGQVSLIGVVTTANGNNQEEAVTTFGLVRDIDTSLYADGTKLYVAADDTGSLTSVAPDNPNFRIWVATVTNQHATQGSIFVSPRIDFADGITFDSLDINNNLTVGGDLLFGSTNISDIYVDEAGDTMTGTLNTRDLIPSTTGTYDLGDSTHLFERAYFGGTSSGGTARANVKGMHVYTGSTDIFVGEDNVFNGYYAQKALPSNSLVTDNTADYSNLYQGDAAEPYIYTNYFTGDGTVVSFSGSDAGLYKGGILQGDYDTTNELGGGGIYFRGRGRWGSVLQHLEQSFHMRGGDGSGMGVSPVLSIGLGGTLATTIKPVGSQGLDLDNTIDLGETANRWKDLYLGGDMIADGSISGGKSVTFSSYRTTAIDTTLLSTDYTLEVTVSGKTATLLTAVGATGRVYIIDNTSGGNITVDTTSSQTISGGGFSGTSISLMDEEILAIRSNGSNWRIMG